MKPGLARYTSITILSKIPGNTISSPYLREEFKKGLLRLPPHLKHITSYTAFNSWTAQFYNTDWVVHLKKQSNNMKANVDYLDKYLKRPPIGETHIKHYDGKTGTYEHLDHYTDVTEIMTLPVQDFISRLICHIPDKNFRNIRYYGFLSNRLRSELLPLVETGYYLKGLRLMENHDRDRLQYDPLRFLV